MHPLKKELLNIDLSKFQSEDGQYLFIKMNELALKKGSGYVNYKWQKPNTNIIDEKISYVYLIKKWDIVIGSGFYLTELKSMLKDEKQSLKKSLANNLKEIYTIITILLFLSMIIAWIISKKIKKVERAQKEHLNMLEQYQLILDKSAVVSKTDTNGIITYSNDNFTKVSGYSKNELIGKSHSIVKHQDTPKSQFKKLWRNIENGKIWKGIIKNKRKDGTSYFNSTTIVPIKDPNGNILEYISSSFDVTELFENRTKLQNIFKTDQLTGLGNRISLLDKINENSKGVLALINIDRFKEVNDIHGHEIGDTIIKNLGERLFKFVEEEDYTLFRLQADVFALFTQNKLETVVEKIEDFIDKEGFKPYKIEQNSFTLSYSCGIAADTENFLAYADMALSEAKNKKIRIKVYDDSMKNISQYKHNILWVEKLHTALAEDRIVPYFQPIYNYHTQKIEKYECLMRLIEDGNIIPPSEYLDIAKKTKLYPKLTYKITAKSINKFANTDKEFSINLSIEDLMNEKLMNFLFDYAEQKDIFNKMVLEIVESEEIEDCEQISTMVKKFKEKGTKVAIDDFGSGYSNYEYLISLQADYIKIDGSITKLILEDKRTEDVVKSIVNFAKKSNMKTIAEFVSSKELDSKLKELGVDYAQGWYYGKAEKELL
jgi:diguanylate cyclase (GGDEF)-like protein/PAS domain S-box-containing protein